MILLLNYTEFKTKLFKSPQKEIGKYLNLDLSLHLRYSENTNI